MKEFPVERELVKKSIIDNETKETLNAFFSRTRTINRGVNIKRERELLIARKIIIHLSMGITTMIKKKKNDQ